MDYFYEGNYPRDRIEEEFGRWLEKVENYIKCLENETKAVK